MAESVVLRPSGANRWVPCPGSASLEPQYVNEEDEAAREGTAAHSLVQMIKMGVVSTPDEMLDRQAENGVYITEEMVEAVQVYFEFLGDIRNWNIEQTIQTITGDPGTPDAYRLHGDTLWVADFKYGWGLIEAKENYQLLDYALSVVRSLEDNAKPSAIHLIVCQPRPAHPRGRTRWWNLTIDELFGWESRIHHAVGLARSDNPTVATGPHCLNCAAMRGCPAGREAALAALQVSKDAMLEDYSEQELAVELELLDLASQAIKNRKEAIEALATEKIRNGARVPGWALERAFGRQKWRDNVDLEALERLYGVELLKKKPITPLQAKRAGVSIDGLSLTPETGVKLVRFDAEATAKEIFK